MRQITLRFALLIALMVIAIGPVQAQEEGQVVVPAGEKIKIAVEVDLTNVLPESGLDVWQGVQVAAEFINEAGGVKGFEIEVFVEDDRCPVMTPRPWPVASRLIRRWWALSARCAPAQPLRPPTCTKMPAS
jgi:hypothetical protein